MRTPLTAVAENAISVEAQAGEKRTGQGISILKNSSSLVCLRHLKVLHLKLKTQERKSVTTYISITDCL